MPILGIVMSYMIPINICISCSKGMFVNMTAYAWSHDVYIRVFPISMIRVYF